MSTNTATIPQEEAPSNAFTNLQDAKEQEFERIVQEIEEKTSQPIYRGRLALPW